MFIAEVWSFTDWIFITMNGMEGFSMKGKKLLFIADALGGEVCGAKTVTYSHLNIVKNIFCNENVDVINLSGIQREEDTDYLSISVSDNIAKRMINLVCGYTGRINRKITEDLLAIIKHNQYDFVFVDVSTYGKLIKEIKDRFPKIVILSYYADVKANLCREWIRKKRLKTIIFLNLMNNERLTQKYCDINLVLNEREKREFKKYYPESQCNILKIPVNSHCVNRKKMALGDPLKILFLGAYYYPNVNGIDWFVKEVFRKLEFPVQLQIVGNGMEVLEAKYTNIQGVEVTGRVDNLEDVYMDCDLVIGPIFEGAGMKVKTAEAFSFGKCYVGTQESLEGYDEDIPSDLRNKYIFKADSSETFITAIKKIRNDASLNQFNKLVFDFYEQNYSRTAIKNELLRIIKEHMKG